MELRTDGKATIINGNANALALEDGSVDLIVTSPPYFALRDYKDGDESLEGQIGAEPTPEQFLDALWSCAQEWWRVLAPGGSLWVNLGDKYSSKTLMGLPWRFAIGMTDGKGDPDGKGWILRAEVIWSKPNGLPESVRDRVRRSHEQWLHFTKSERYYSAIDAIREPHKDTTVARRKNSLVLMTTGANAEARDGQREHGSVPLNPLGKLPDSVWTIPTEPLRVPAELGIDHFAAFPTEWPRRIILGWAPTRGICETCGEGLRPVADKHGPSTWEERQGKRDSARVTTGNSGLNHVGAHPREARKTTITGWACACDEPGETRLAVVLDPFGGTGTTAAVAKALGCHGISNDLSESYCTLAEWRCNGDGYEKVRARVIERTTGTKPKKPRKPKSDQQPTLLDE